MGLFSRFKNVSKKSSFQMITDVGNGFYVWNGKLYQSDIVRSCIRPKTKAIGKAVAKHIRETFKKDGSKDIAVNPMPYIKNLLEEPNEYMSGQMMQEKVANQEPDAEEKIEQLTQYSMLEQYDGDVLSNIIDKVLIYNDKDIEVVFKGENFIRNAV